MCWWVSDKEFLQRDIIYTVCLQTVVKRILEGRSWTEGGRSHGAHDSHLLGKI